MLRLFIPPKVSIPTGFHHLMFAVGLISARFRQNFHIFLAAKEEVAIGRLFSWCVWLISRWAPCNSCFLPAKKPYILEVWLMIINYYQWFFWMKKKSRNSTSMAFLHLLGRQNSTTPHPTTYNSQPAQLHAEFDIWSSREPSVGQ